MEAFGMQPGMDRLNLLPRHDKKRGWIAPNALYQLARAVVSPGVAAKGGSVSEEDGINFGGNLVGTGLGASALVPTRGKGIMGMAVKPDYGIAHRPPGRHYGAPAHDLTRLLPDDIYSQNAVRYYGHMGEAMDAETFRIVRSLRNRPDQMVKIYRAVPLDVPFDAPIQPGDWVTLNKAYARSHGDSVLEGKYRVIESKVPAKDLYTGGDSIHEWGYDPE
jgi:hypothetical protein